MNTTAATALYLAFIAGLFLMERRYRPMTSAALWIPIAWWSIVSSRPVSFWITGEVARYDNPGQSLEGSPLDAGVYLFLLVFGLVVLARRRVQLSVICRDNAALCLFMGYCLVSVAWSDYPVGTAKRWVKDCGSVIAVLIVATDADPRAAVRAVLGRCAYLVVPTSVMLIKYYTEIGRYYDPWTWEPIWSGVTSEKNALGATAMLCGIFLVWDILYARRRSRSPTLELPGANERDSSTSAGNARRFEGFRPPQDSWGWLYFGSQLVLCGMVLWLISKANSSTALVGLLIGAALVISLGWESRLRQHFVSNLWGYVILISVTAALLVTSTDILNVFFDSLGEDASLTGRTDLWADVIALSDDTILGAGYQSFWLGNEAQIIWHKYYFHPNQAHNGYIETYLNGGFVGLGLLSAFLWASTTRLRARLLEYDVASILFFALLIVTMFYNITEAVFNRLSPVWLACLLACTSYSCRAR